MDKKQIKSLTKDKKYKIVFIGNSFTYFNDMPDIFKDTAEAMGYEVEVYSFVFGDARLYQHGSAEHEEGAKLDGFLKEEKVDFAVLQEQSINPATEVETFFRGCRMCAEKIKVNGATPVMYATWGREDNHEDLVEHNMTHEEMTWRVAASYRFMAEEWNGLCAEVGMAFTDLYRHYPEIRPFVSDGCNHPTLEGSYMAALTIFATIFGVDVRNVPDDNRFSAEVNEALRECAYKAVFFEHPLPDGFVIR